MGNAAAALSRLPPPTTSQPQPAPAPAHPYAAPASNSHGPNPNGAASAYPGPYYPPQVHAYYDPSAAAERRRFAFFMIACMLAFSSIFCLVTLITWAVLRPVVPIFSLSAASISDFNLSSSHQFFSKFDLTFSVSNPNKKLDIYYDRVQALVAYGGNGVTTTSLRPFLQGTGGSNSVVARLAADGDIMEESMAKAISEERGENGSVEFDIRILIGVRFKSGIWSTESRTLRVYCDDVRFKFANVTASNALFVGPMHHCFVTL